MKPRSGFRRRRRCRLSEPPRALHETTYFPVGYMLFFWIRAENLKERLSMASFDFRLVFLRFAWILWDLDF